MVASGHRPRQTYCVGFSGGDRLADEGFSDDLQYARQVAASLQVPLTPIEVLPPVASDIENLVYMLDEPQADPAPLFVAAIAKAARADGIKVLLGGAGGDDIFSGYRRHKAAAARARIGPALGLLTHPVVGRLSGHMSKPLRRRFDKLQYMFDGSDEEFLLRAFEFNPQGSALAVLSADVRAAIVGGEPGWLQEACAKSRGQPLVERMLDLELHGFLPDHNLNYTDKASMAHGVEVRVPFLDKRLLAFARTVPWQFKTGLRDEKVILKQAVSTRLPPGILTRKKTGFGAPMRAWIAGPMRGLAEDVFASSSFATRGLFDVAATRRLLADTISGRQDGAYLVLAVIMTELWLRRFTAPANGAA
jgi:asparagine synthase (glutamine-hydrolysing)